MVLLSITYRLKSAMDSVRILLVAAFCLFFLIPTADAGRFPEKMIRRNTERLDADLIVSADTLITKYKKGVKPLFIDIRSARDFDALHITGAMNIPLHFIKTKTYLKSSPLVLVDRGLAAHRLSPACRRLRNLGFDARILEGGMNAWSSHGGRMTGEPVRQMDYRRISPADFFKEKNYSNRIVCDVSAIRSDASKQLMPYALHLPLAGNADAESESIAQFKSTHARGNAAAVIVVNGDGKGYRSVGHLFNHAGLKTVFYLDGGIEAYGKYLDGLVSSWRPRAQRVRTDSPCRSCGNNE
mgnify:CR=1 FL=1